MLIEVEWRDKYKPDEAFIATDYAINGSYIVIENKVEEIFIPLTAFNQIVIREEKKGKK